MFPSWAKNILFLLVFMISGLVLVLIIEGLLSGSELIPLNLVIERVVMHVRTPLITDFLVLVTRIGNPFVLSSATALIAVLLIMRRRYYEATIFIVSMIVAIVSLTVLKNTFQITRPNPEAIDASGWSFPSGHATVATTFFFMLSHALFSQMRTVGRKTALILGSIISSSLICFSRLYLGAHWTLDILAGIALGMLSVSFTVLLFSIFIEPRRSIRNKISS